MRKIIFRGKKDCNNEWVYGNLIQFDWADFIVKYGSFEERQRVIPETVSQFTGLTDRNGKEIYEGDIIRHEDYTKGCYFNCKQPERKSLVVVNNLFDGVKLRGLGFSPYSEDTIKHFEIIGNIHDNPELLTSNKER